MRVGIVAGEASGDNLAAGLIRALRERVSELQVFGVAGPRMQAEGCEAWAQSEELAVMGLTEVIRHLPRLVKLRRRLVRRFLESPPDVFVGVDAPDFNLGLEQRLRDGGIRTVQYVSPSVWAWRKGRMKKIKRASDCVLCLLPFEKKFYDEQHHPAVFVGHPLADEIPLSSPAPPARVALAVPPGTRLLAILPGSRVSEVTRIGPVFAQAIAMLAREQPALSFIAPMASKATRSIFEQQLREHAPGVLVQLVDGEAQLVMTAADTVLLASGTAVLEALLVGRPHVVAYRIAPTTASLVRRFKLMQTPYFALTNVLAGRELVPEFIQEKATPAALAQAVARQLYAPGEAHKLTVEFRAIQERLRQDASRRSAQAVIDVVANSQ